MPRRGSRQKPGPDPGNDDEPVTLTIPGALVPIMKIIVTAATIAYVYKRFARPRERPSVPEALQVHARETTRAQAQAYYRAVSEAAPGRQGRLRAAILSALEPCTAGNCSSLDLKDPRQTQALYQVLVKNYLLDRCRDPPLSPLKAAIAASEPFDTSMATVARLSEWLDRAADPQRESVPAVRGFRAAVQHIRDKRAAVEECIPALVELIGQKIGEPGLALAAVDGAVFQYQKRNPNDATLKELHDLLRKCESCIDDCPAGNAMELRRAKMLGYLLEVKTEALSHLNSGSVAVGVVEKLAGIDSEQRLISEIQAVDVYGEKDFLDIAQQLWDVLAKNTKIPTLAKLRQQLSRRIGAERDIRRKKHN